MQMKSSALFALSWGALTAVSLPQATCDAYVIPSIAGGFTQRSFIDFSGVQPGGDAASFLSARGLSISNYGINSSPLPRTFVPQNVALGSGSLDLKVSAYTGSGSVQSAEVVTNDVFKYASVRVMLKSSGVPGVVEGNFFYLNDNQEIDWEILTSTTLQPSANVPAGIWATNQAVVPGTPNTHAVIPFTFDPSQAYHEYRIDASLSPISPMVHMLTLSFQWSSNATTFYIDGVQKASFTTNVPTQTGSWIWNAWSSGDPNWSNGPPTANSITHIRSIDIYKGYTATRSGSLCNI